MKLFRQIVLTVAILAFPTFLLQAVGQQEVSPDHFDQYPAPANVQTAKAQSNHKVASAHRGHVKLANKHANHHRRVSA